MAYGKSKKGNGDGSNVPPESCELDGAIVTAACSTMEARSYAEGYPEPKMDGWTRLKMRQGKA